MRQYDIAVIGAGPAGYIAAISGAQMGASVILFEKSVLGGTCLNRGCIPTKTYLKGAEIIHHIRMSERYGIVSNTEYSMDMKKAVGNKNAVVKQLTQGVGALLRSNGVEVVYGDACLAAAESGCERAKQVSGLKVVVCGGQEYVAHNVLLCGGSKAGRIPIPGIDHENVLTSDEILDLEQLPKRLGIIGGGVIGCEIGAAFSAYGCEVTIIEEQERILPQMDVEISESLRETFQRDGIRVLTASRVRSIKHASGECVLVCENDDRITVDKILLSIGRTADLSCLGAFKEQIALERGYVHTDEFLQTSIPGIYAPGDINGKSMLAHAAFKMGEAAAKNAMGERISCDLCHIPGCIYTLPECAGVGLTQEQARRQMGADQILVGRFPFAANGRALACGAGTGFVKVIVGRTYQELLGVHIFGGMATEMIAEAASLMAAEVLADEIGEMIHAHPTFSEAFMEACADATGQSMHLPKSNRSPCRSGH